jgi:hypothetical protein
MKTDEVYPWKSISPKDAKGMLVSNYRNEEHFNDVVELNLPLICARLFDQQYISHKREFSFPSTHNSKPKVDFLVYTDSDIIAIEAKVPKKRRQSGVYQLMQYFTLAKIHGIKITRFALLTTDLNQYDDLIIREFNLPIEVFFICKEKVIRICHAQKQ